MKINHIASTWPLLAFVLAPFDPCGAASLVVGDSAPKLQVSQWVQGKPVKEFEKDSAYIVEFWATWCGPCRVSIPHLNEIHNKYKDKGLVVIGQDVWETKTEDVAPFVKKMGDQMTYRVALDTLDHGETNASNGKMAETWMKAAGRRGIPSAFLVDKMGRIAWIGHPMSLKEGLIEAVLSGKFDLTKATGDYKKQIRFEAGWTELNGLIREDQWDKAAAKLTELEQLSPEDERWGLGLTRFQILMGKKDYKAAEKLAAASSDAHKDNASLQNEFAWAMVSNDDYKNPDLDLAEKLARRANDAAKGKDAATLDTLARVLFMKGEKDEAIKTQQKAVDLAEGRAQVQLQSVLDSYKKGKLPPAD